MTQPQPQPIPPSPRTLVEAMKRRGELADPRIEAAFLRIPRAAFLPGVPLEQVYSDEAIPIQRAPDGTVLSSSSQPSMMAIMLAQLHLQPGHNLLEIGTGSGYNAALMQVIVGSRGNVTTLEVDPVVAAQAQDNLQRVALGEVSVVQTDGAGGFSPRAAYDRILAAVGIWDVPGAWVRQLKPRGILVAPLWLEGLQYSAAFHLQADGSLYSERNLPCGFVRLRGTARGPQVELRIGDSLTLYTGDAARLDAAAVRMLILEDAQSDRLRGDWSAGHIMSGLAPYIILNAPRTIVFAAYAISGGAPYGLTGGGIALFLQGSAAFLPADGGGVVQAFGSADALLILQDLSAAWRSAGAPSSERLRLRLTPIERGTPEVHDGRLFRRAEHLLSAWLGE